MKRKADKSKRRKTDVARIGDWVISCRLPDEHIEILGKAMKVTSRDRRNLVRACFERALIKAAPNLVLANLAADADVQSIKDAINANPRHQLVAALSPSGYGFDQHGFHAIAEASEAGPVTKTDILTMSIETELTEVVRSILVEHYLAHDKATLTKLGKLAAHLSRNPSSGLKGGPRLMAAINGIAARSRRGKKRSQVVGNKR